MATRIYLTNDQIECAGFSTLPLAVTVPDPDLSLGLLRDLSLVHKGVGGGSAQSPLINSLPQTAVQRLFFGKWVSPPLTGITTLSANTWTVGYVGREGNLNANAQPLFVIYVMKADGTVRGFVKDVDAGQGIELSNVSPPPAQVYTITGGSAVSGILPTDRLVIEVYTRGAQGSATSYSIRGINYNGDVDPVDGVADATASNATFIQTPQDGLFDPSAPPPDPGGETKLYLRFTATQAVGHVAAEKSAAMSPTAQMAQIHDLSETKGAGPAQVDGIDSPSVGLGRYYFGKWVSQDLVGLASGSWPAGDIHFALSGNVDVDADSYFQVSVYILKADDTIRGYISDQDIIRGTELATASRGREFDVTGVAVASIASTDKLCVEIWRKATPAAVAIRQRIRYDGTTDPVEGVAAADAASYIIVPASALFGASVTLTHSGTITPSGTHTLVPGAALTHSGTITPSATHVLELSEGFPLFQGFITPAGHHTLTPSAAGGGSQGNSDPCDPGDVQWFLTYCNHEVSNLARTWEYLQRYRPRNIEIICAPNGILYRVAGATPDVHPFVHPSTDPAPWYDPGRPESAEFLGFVGKPKVGPAVSRSITRRAFGGASLGPLRQTEREVQVDGFIFAVTSRGLDYGLRYLSDLMAGDDDCATCQVEIRTASPNSDGSDDTVGAWRLYNVGLTDPGVEEKERYGNQAMAVTFTLVAGDGYLYKDPELVLPLVAIPDVPPGGCVGWSEWMCGAPTGNYVTATVDPPPFGQLGTILTIDARDSGINGVRLDVMQDCGNDTVVGSIRTEAIPEGTVLVIDSAREVITWIDVDGAQYDGSMFIHLRQDETIPWVVVKATDQATCLRVGRDRWCSTGTGQVRVALQTQERRR